MRRCRLEKLAASTLLAVALCAPLSAEPASPPTSLQRAIDAALNAATLTGAHVGAFALDANTGAVLYARNADDDFIPASTLKLIVGSAALARLGPAYGFVTGVSASGTTDAGTLNGDLYLRGGGDAQLLPTDLNGAAAAIAATGVRRVSGAVVADASRYDAPRYPPGWAIDDIPYEYAAVPSALGLDLNVAHVRVRAGSAVGDATRLELNPRSDAFAIENASVTGAAGSQDTTDLARPWDRPATIEVTGSYPLGAPISDDLAPAVPDPAAYAADFFAKTLAAHGLTVAGGTRSGTTPPATTPLWTHRSQPLRTLVRDFWLPSNNLIGEQLLEELGAAAGRSDARSAEDTRQRGIDIELAWLRSIGVDADAVTIVDGSGLSAYDRLTPRALTTVLQADWRGPERATVMSALPVAGTSGTLRAKFGQAPLLGAIFAKTGSENHARLLAGYARARSGNTAIFALMINDWMDASPHAERALDAARAAVLTALVTR